MGLLLDRSADAIVALLGILKAGAAYVPLATDAPPARIATQLTESRAALVVTSSAAAATLPAGVPHLDIAAADGNDAPFASHPASATALAYVLYTSGSTGTPKGVAVTQANVVHYTRSIGRVLGSLDGRQVALASTLAADLGYTALFPALLGGATLHVLSRETTTEPERWGGLHRRASHRRAEADAEPSRGAHGRGERARRSRPCCRGSGSCSAARRCARSLRARC